MGRAWRTHGREEECKQRFGGKAEGKRKLRGPRRRWENNVKMDLRERGWDALNWTHLCQDVDQWRSLVNTVMIAGFEVLTAMVMTITIFWDSPFKINWRLGGIYRLNIQGRISRAKFQRESRWQATSFTLVSYSAYLTLKVEPICSSETSVDFQRTTLRYIQEDSTLREWTFGFHEMVRISSQEELSSVGSVR
jgi:hypothetical protein